MKLKYILPAIMLTGATLSQAQTQHSAYFLEGNSFRHELNPSFMGEYNYISIPVLGNLNVNTRGNIGLKDIIYKYNDPQGKYKYTTFLSPTVDSKSFLNQLHNVNRIGVDLNMPIISVGFKGLGGFNTVSVNVHSITNVRVPKTLFEFMKLGQTSQSTTYNIKDLGIRSSNYAELALGHSREINDQWTVGAKVKILLGLAHVNFHIDELNATLAEDKWIMNGKGQIDLGINGLEFENKVNDDNEITNEIDGMNGNFGGLNGFGLAFDLGATYKLDDQWTFSAALLDLGFISWNSVAKGNMNGNYEFDGFDNFTLKGDDDENGKQLSDQFDNMSDDLKDAFNFINNGNGSITNGLKATLNLAAEYKMPFYDKLSAGLLWSTYINGPYTWTEGRLSANVSPLKWLNGGINYGISTFGSTFGWMINFHPKGFNFFLGGDSVFSKLNKQCFPVSRMNNSISLGMNVTF